MRKSALAALGGITVALIVFILILGGMIPGMEYATPLIAGLLVISIQKEAGIRPAATVYIAASLLSLLVVPNREISVTYILVFGHYPILKLVLERIKNPVINLILKLAVLNACTVAAVFITVAVFGIPLEGMEDFGKYTVPILVGIMNFTFIVYDKLLDRMAVLYDRRISGNIRRLMK